MGRATDTAGMLAFPADAAYARAPMTKPDPVVPLTAVEPAKPPFWTWRRFKQLGPAGVMGVISLVVPPIGGATLAYITARTPFAEVLRDQPWGAPASAAGFGLFGGFALLPTAVLAIFAGWAFHFRVGFAVAVAGFTIAAAIGYAVARRQIEAAKKGTDTAVTAFKNLGISAAELKRQSPEQTLTAVSDGMAKLGVGMLIVSIVATLVVLVVITILARRALDRIA